MTLLEAIIKVLREAEKPLHAKENTKKIHASGLWSTGKNPKQLWQLDRIQKLRRRFILLVF